MKKILEGSNAVAETVGLVKPAVIAAYPITPQTHIVEELAKMVANGKLKSKYLEVESEFSALSACIGATATGFRSFTSTSSQGLALMHELLFAGAGMRLPLVMIVANRALSAPINIWNDQQDSISERDSGWVQIYVETVQEAVDSLLQAYKIAEENFVPVMICMDGFYLTHVIEPVDIPEQNKTNKFLPEYIPKFLYLNPKKPITQGGFAYPLPYMNSRKQLSDSILDSIKTVKKVNEDFFKHFKRKYGDGLVEEYKNDRNVCIVAMGSVCGTIKEVVDKTKGVGLVRVRCFRPFPRDEIEKVLKNKKAVIVIDRDISLGNRGALFTEIRDSLYGLKQKPKIVNFIAGLGGVDISMEKIKKMIELSKNKEDGDMEWLI
jgi:pyruvate ferredoxin oxidoreductase alpha subunit